jgi:hypothetical protein
MYKFPTVKDVMEKLKNFPEDAEVHIGHFSAFLDENLKSTKGLITEKQAYYMYPASSIEYGDFYEDHYNSNPSGITKRTCVIISSD